MHARGSAVAQRCNTQLPCIAACAEGQRAPPGREGFPAALEEPFSQSDSASFGVPRAVRHSSPALSAMACGQWNALGSPAPSSATRRGDRGGRRTGSHCGSWRAWGCGCYSFYPFPCPCLSRFLACAASLALLS